LNKFCEHAALLHVIKYDEFVLNTVRANEWKSNICSTDISNKSTSAQTENSQQYVPLSCAFYS